MSNNRLKNLSTAVNVTRRSTRILLREVNQKKFFYTKTALFNPRADQTDATQACLRRT